MVDGRPVSVTAHYFPYARFPGMDKVYEETGSITKAFLQFGVDDYFRKTSRVSARLPDADDARLLKMARAQPILHTESINVDKDGRPVEYSVGLAVRKSAKPENLRRVIAVSMCYLTRPA